jgi:hypothetical protein
MRRRELKIVNDKVVDLWSAAYEGRYEPFIAESAEGRSVQD